MNGTGYTTNTLYEPTGKIGQINHQNNTHTRYTYDPNSESREAIRVRSTLLTETSILTGDHFGDVVSNNVIHLTSG